MSVRRLLGRRCACAGVLLMVACPVTAVASPAGPADDSFYAPPSRLVGGPEGSVVWTRPAAGLAVLPAAARTEVVVYRSRSLRGEQIVDSGTVLIPKGDAPEGGWPIVSFFHVTTGAGDSCAPSRVTPENPELERLTRADQVVSRLLRAGVAVARPDGEGIGTPGGHPYLIGRSLARAQVDIVRAARELDPRIGRRWAAAGHSEGGVATLFSASLGRALAPELDLRAAAAFSPVTRTKDLLEVFSNDPATGPPSDGLSALASLIITGAGEADPVLGGMLRTGALSDEAVALLPDVERRCLVELTKADSWGGLAPSAIPGPAYEGEAKQRFYKVLDDNDVANIDLRGLPIRIDHGMLDAVAPQVLSEELVSNQRARGADITYGRWPTATHVDITSDAQAGPEAAAWLVARLGRGAGPGRDEATSAPAVPCRSARTGSAVKGATLRPAGRGVLLRFSARTSTRLRITVTRRDGTRRMLAPRRVRACRTYHVRLAATVVRVRITAPRHRAAVVTRTKGTTAGR